MSAKKEFDLLSFASGAFVTSVPFFAYLYFTRKKKFRNEVASQKNSKDVAQLIFEEPVNSNDFIESTNETKQTNLSRIGILEEAKLFNIKTRLIPNPSIKSSLGTVLCLQYKNKQELLANGTQFITQATEFDRLSSRFRSFLYLLCYNIGLNCPKTIFIGSKKRVSPDIHHLKTDKGPIVGYYIGEDINDLTTSDAIISLIREKLNYPKNSIYIKQDHKLVRSRGNKKLEKNNENKETNKITIGQKNAIFKAIGDALHQEETLIIQEAIEAKEYRIYLIKGIICSVIERILPQVIGNGEHTIKKLIEIENATEWRQSVGAFINITDDLINNLKKLNLTLTSIAGKNSHINLRSTSNKRLAKDVTDTVHSSFKKALEKLYTKLDLIQVGVDLLCDDIAKDIKEQKYYILDWDNRHGIEEHQNPQYGQPRNVCRAILGHAFPELQSNPLYNSRGGPAPNPFQTKNTAE